MRKITILIGLLAFLMIAIGTTTSCSRKTGCPVNEEAHFKDGKKAKRGTSNLFPKKMRRNR